jgi:WD40 repeat protein
VLTGSGDKTARLWEATTGKAIGTPMPHQGAVEAVAFSPDGRLVLTGSPDKTARLWDPATGKPAGPPLMHPDQVGVVAFSPDNRTFVTSGQDKTARLWQAPAPVEGTAERLVLWIQVTTGMELDAEGAVRKLDDKTRQERRKRLEKLGGPPSP